MRPGDLTGIVFRDSAEGLAPHQLRGFFADWRRPVSPEEHLLVLRRSAVIALAVDSGTHAVVGFATALSDGVLCAHITLLEVLPSHRRRGIGRALVLRLENRLGALCALDVVCEPELLPFYERCGLRPAAAAIRRHHPPSPL